MTGRPSSFTQEIADEICDRISKGESLRSICSDDESGWLPTKTTVMRWLADEKYVAFRDQYTRAREAQADHYVEQIIEIADAPNMTVNAQTGEQELRDPARDRLRVDARKWVASKLAPKKYGDKVALTGGDDGDAPIKVTSIVRKIVDPDD